MLRFRNIPLAKKFTDQRRGWREYQDFLSKYFSSRSAKNFRRRTFCAVFQKVSGGEKVWIKRGGENQAFPSKTFCLTVPKNFVGEPFCASFQRNSASEKVYGSEARRRVSSFSVENFVSECQKKS